MLLDMAQETNIKAVTQLETAIWFEGNDVVYWSPVFKKDVGSDSLLSEINYTL